jgi:drug/metabolite transporter (DMT)-like permease
LYKGILYLLLATFTFALVNMGVKLLNDPNFLIPEPRSYPVYEVVFFRSLISLSICLAVIRAKKIPILGNNKKWLLVRGLTGATGLYLFFLTIQNMPMAVATTVQYLSPVFTIIIAIFLLNEKVKPIQWLFITISLSGIFVMGYDPGKMSDAHLTWLIVGVVSAFFSGIAYNAIMKCRDTDHPVVVVMYFPLVATPIMLVMCILNGFIIPAGIEWIILLLIGILTQVAQVCMTRAFIADSASTVAPLKYLGSVYAVLIGLFVFDETVSLYATTGMIFVVSGVILNTWYKKRKAAVSLTVS